MSLVERTKRLLAVSGSGGIFRRYLIVNGFDGALTMLGLIIGFMVSAPTDLAVIVNACHSRRRRTLGSPVDCTG